MSKEDISIINIIYKYKKNMKIFGSEFVKNNKNKCKMIIDDKEYEIYVCLVLIIIIFT